MIGAVAVTPGCSRKDAGECLSSLICPFARAANGARFGA